MNHIRTHQGHSPVLKARVFVDNTAVIIGRVTLGEDSSVWPLVSIRGDLMPIEIGKNTNIQDGSCLHTSQPSAFSKNGHALTIGDNVTVGHKVLLHGCTLHDGSLIGMGSIVLDGAVIESQVFLAAGSLVAPNKVLRSGYLYRGAPAVQARPLTEEELRFLVFSPQSYVALKNTYLTTAKVSHS